MIPNSLLVGVLLIFGLIAAALLWGFGVVPWWQALITVVAAPLTVCVVLLLVFYALSLASGDR